MSYIGTLATDYGHVEVRSEAERALLDLYYSRKAQLGQRSRTVCEKLIARLTNEAKVRNQAPYFWLGGEAEEL